MENLMPKHARTARRKKGKSPKTFTIKVDRKKKKK